MTAINNLKGHIINDGKVIYDEVLSNGLHFSIIFMYEDKYMGKNILNHQNSSNILIESSINTGKIHTYSNGIKALIDDCRVEKSYKNKPFKDLEKIKTKDGFLAYQVELRKHTYDNIINDDSPIESRTVEWIIEVPKKYLIEKVLDSIV